MVWVLGLTTRSWGYNAKRRRTGEDQKKVKTAAERAAQAPHQGRPESSAAAAFMAVWQQAVVQLPQAHIGQAVKQWNNCGGSKKCNFHIVHTVNGTDRKSSCNACFA